MSYPKVKIIADSINAIGKRITTFECEYHRYIAAEALTHKMLSRNSASSRAIPVSSIINQVRTEPAMPVEFGKNQSGMQAKELLTDAALDDAKEAWSLAAQSAANFSEDLAQIGVHKQIANRVTEPFQYIKVLLTATEWNNFFLLRNHPDAQPEIQALAKEMLYAMNKQEKLTYLKEGEWHLPYIETKVRDTDDGNTLDYFDSQGNQLNIEQALMISASCCAQVSYRKNDDSLEKAQNIFNRLVESKPVHASPLEHSACCIDSTKVNPYDVNTWPQGLTHVDRDGKLWSGNLQGWIQHRQLISDNYLKG